MSSTYFVTVVADTGDKTEEWTEWAKGHTADPAWSEAVTTAGSSSRVGPRTTTDSEG